MKRVVVIIEDRLSFGGAKDMLLSVEGLLLNADPTFYEDVPTANNTTIIFGHICWDVTDDLAAEFKNEFDKACSDMLSEFKAWTAGTQQIPVHYLPIRLSRETYEKQDGDSKCGEEVVKKIDEEISRIFKSSPNPSQVKTVVLLDVLLFYGETREIARILSDSEKALSENIFLRWTEIGRSVIPYTQYEGKAELARIKWAEKVGRKGEIPYERHRIADGRIYIPFKKEIFGALDIQEKQSRKARK